MPSSTFLISFLIISAVEALPLGNNIPSIKKLERRQCFYEQELDTYHCEFPKDKYGNPWGFYFDAKPATGNPGKDAMFKSFNPNNHPHPYSLREHKCNKSVNGNYECNFKFKAKCPDGEECQSSIEVVPPGLKFVDYVSSGARFTMPAWIQGNAHASDDLDDIRTNDLPVKEPELVKDKDIWGQIASVGESAGTHNTNKE